MSSTIAEDTNDPHPEIVVLAAPVLGSNSGWDRLRTFLVLVLLTLFLLCMHLSQLVLWPMSCVPGGFREWYWDYIRHSKESFARVLVLLSGGTTLAITADTAVDFSKVVTRDEKGAPLSLKFEPRSVWISNHQTRADWVTAWCFFYLADLHGALVMAVEKSLKYVPIAGRMMRLFSFLETNQDAAGTNLRDLGRRSTANEKTLAVLLFPEENMVSPDTRAKSTTQAATLGIPDLKNILLPRSAGLFNSLRTLLPVASDFVLYDMTVGDPGSKTESFTQSFSALVSTYATGHAPAKVHIHLRSFEVSDIPTGTPTTDPSLTLAHTSAAATPKDRDAFDVWLRARWMEKDELLNMYYAKGEFPVEREEQRIELKIALKGFDDYLALVSNFIPLYLGWRATVYAYQYLS